LPYALSFITALFGFGRGDGVEYHVALYLDNQVLVALAAGILFSTPIAPWISSLLRQYMDNGSELHSRCLEVGLTLGRKVILACVLGAATLSVAAGTYNPFIYFRF
jgi:alginate O-acetyltransferase complex protein AlgI